MKYIKTVRSSYYQSLVLCALVFGAPLWGQEDASQQHGSEEQVKDPGLEVVLSGLLSYAPKAGHADLATELHVTYWTSHTWAFGIGYSQIYEGDGRIGHELAGLVSVKPWPFLTTNFGPSLALPNSHSDTELSAYIELELNFEIEGFHTGPLVGTLIGNEFRWLTGVHLGYDF